MKIAIGTDHRGFSYKEFIKKNLKKINNQIIEWSDVGCYSSDTCDYPIFAKLVAQAVQSGEADLGILLCGSGVGVSIAANRFKGIYAGLAWNEETARLGKEHDNVNVLVFPADVVSEEMLIPMITAWLQASFLGGRYQKRLEMIDE